jgi:hypothetical protein
MNMDAWAYVGGVAVLAAGPIVAVVIGSRAFDDDDDEAEPAPTTCSDDTTHIERVADAGPYDY